MNSTFSVALIGGDGAGKSTIARRLETTFPFPVKCLYMGINLESSNVVLPTSRLLQFLRHARHNRVAARNHAHPSPNRKNTQWYSVGISLRRGLWLLNQLAEEWYRQLLAWSYLWRGWIVVFDRHFKFDFEYLSPDTGDRARSQADRLHRWLLTKLYPRPDLVIYLDAPASVLYARKGESTPQRLDLRRQAFLRRGEQTLNFIRIDASRPLETVYAEVAAHITQFRE